MENSLGPKLTQNWIRKSCNKSQTIKHSFFNPKYVKFIDSIKRKSTAKYNNQEFSLKQLVTNQLSSNNENTLSTTGRTLNNKDLTDKNLVNIQPKTIELIDKKDDDKFLRNLLFNKCKIKNYFSYIYKIQKFYNDECSYKVKFRGRLSTKEIENDEFNNDIELLEFVIARYSIIIFYLMKNQKMSEAKKMLLLMIKENLMYFQYFQNSFYNFILRNLRQIQNFNTKKIPHKICLLLKFYQIILKYMTFFNITKYRDFFLGKYLSLHFLNYYLYELRCQVRNYTNDTRNHVKYFYSQCLYNASYYSIYTYTSMKIPLTLCNKILNTYNDIEEETLTIKEKNLLINASFNKSLYLYILAKNELAINQFEITKKKLISFYKNDDVDNALYENDEEEESSNVNTILNKNTLLRQSRRLLLKQHTLSNKLIIKRQETRLRRKNALRNDENVIEDIKKLIKNPNIRPSVSQNDPQKIFDILFTNNNGKLKNNLTMEDIKKLIFLNVKDMIGQGQKNRKNSVTDFDMKNILKFQKDFGVSQNKNDTNYLMNLRGSHVNYETLLKIKKLNIPKYLREPLLIDIELLMCEIELDQNDYKNAYEHIKNTVLIIFVLRQINDTAENKEKKNEYLKKHLNILTIFLSKIENLAIENSCNCSKNAKKNIIRNTRTVRLSKSIRSLFMNRNYDSQEKNDNFAKNIKRKLSMIALSNLNTDNQKNYKNYVNQKINLEIEKFFIFLNSLSMYQIKVLNETQPKKEDHNEIRNYLPLFFSTQFINTLTLSQKNSLDLIHTMSFTRNAVLNDPTKFITPSNLKISFLSGGSFWNSMKIPKKKVEENKVYENIENGISTKKIPKTKEFLSIKKLFMNNNNSYQQFLLDNYSLVVKIFKNLCEKEIEGILNEPGILIDSVNDYKATILRKLLSNENGNDKENEKYQNEINLLVNLKGYESVNDFFKSKERSHSKDFIEINLSAISKSNEDEDKSINGFTLKNKNDVSFISKYIEAD